MVAGPTPAVGELADGSEEMDHAIVAYTFLASTDCGDRKDTVYFVLAWPVGQIVQQDELGDWERTRCFVRGTMGDGFSDSGDLRSGCEAAPYCAGHRFRPARQPDPRRSPGHRLRNSTRRTDRALAGDETRLRLTHAWHSR